jgi:MFS family permease
MDMKKLFNTIRQLTEPSAGSIPELKRRTQTLSVWEGGLWAVMWGLGESYIAPFALFLGANNFVMAFVGTGPVLITALAQLGGAALLDRVGKRKPLIMGGIAAQTLIYLPLFILPVLLPAIGIYALIVCMTLYYILQGIVVPSWMSLMGDVVEESERGRYFSNRTRLITYCMIFAMLTAGIIANQWKAIGYTAVGFGFLFGIAALARAASLFFMRQHYDAPLDPASSDDHFSFWAFLRDPENKNYAKFTFAIALMNGTTNIAGPFFAVYMLRDLEWSYLAFTFNMLTFMISQTLFVRWWGGIGDRHGNRAVLMATGSLLPLLPIVWAFSSNYTVLLFAQIASGAVWSGFNLAALNFIYDSVPQSRRARASSYYSVINGLFSVTGGLLIGAHIAEHAPSSFNLGMIHVTLRSSLPVVFVVSSLLRVVAASIMLPQFSEVRSVEPISTGRIIWQLTTGQPLFGQVGEFMPRLLALRRNRNHDKD